MPVHEMMLVPVYVIKTRLIPKLHVLLFDSLDCVFYCSPSEGIVQDIIVAVVDGMVKNSISSLSESP